ncbi:hypothetical protein BpHYR1_013536 [Brachionus plicatilis]|uniref:Uncharacterized protein n=1 Tax=Brachionus plicatilis TaxID=10195 RepID=A0A3M7SIL8_BRAPC|nr:hypothetical protein BpHYR1_013536 [Brachionus plicatilis]
MNVQKSAKMIHLIINNILPNSSLKAHFEVCDQKRSKQVIKVQLSILNFDAEEFLFNLYPNFTIARIFIEKIVLKICQNFVKKIPINFQLTACKK